MLIYKSLIEVQNVFMVKQCVIPWKTGIKVYLLFQVMYTFNINV